MDTENQIILEGIFGTDSKTKLIILLNTNLIKGVAKPANVSSADVLQKLQTVFQTSQLFAPLLKHQPKRISKSDDQVFKLGHGGTLDPLAAGVLIVGIGRGTKQLQQYLACRKTYETVVLFGASTDTYDTTGVVDERADFEHVTRQLVEEQLEQFRGDIQQFPPAYSALKINGIKACDYVRQGKELPRQLESREMRVDQCELLEWYDAGQHPFTLPREAEPALAPAARVRLTVSSGFYVRSFAHDLGLACKSRSHMVLLVRTHQANFTIMDLPEADYVPAVTYEQLEASEESWASILQPQLEAWVKANPAKQGHVNGRDREVRQEIAGVKNEQPKQRFRGGWVADTKAERIRQQGGKFKGKWNQNPRAVANTTIDMEEQKHALPTV